MKFNRRTFMTGAGATLVAASALKISPVKAVESATGNPNLYTKEIDAGVAYFQKRVTEQLPLIQQLVKAIESGNLSAAQSAYLASRPPYEEIEVLAPAFAQEDTDIDARPYAFDGGETDPGFKGFHKVEILLFRDEDLTAALPVAKELEQSILKLQKQLATRTNFDAVKNFSGILALATEVPAKKISSEEETWSDQSLIIFKHNFVGIKSQYDPFASMITEKNADAATTVEATYKAAMATVEPFFTPGKVAAKPYSQITIAERRAISKAAYAYRDAIMKVADLLKVV